MRVAEVAVRIAAKQLNQPFTYQIPEHLTGTVLVGKRVEIPLQRKISEGYVLEERDVLNEKANTYKMILDVLDLDPVLSPAMISLGRWMADYYVVSLQECLDLMVPSMISQARMRTIKLRLGVDILSQTELLTGRQQSYLKWLEAKKNLSWQESLEWLNEEELFDLEKKEIIERGHQYRVSRINKEDNVYVATVQASVIPNRAKKQREALEFVLNQQYADPKLLLAKFSGKTINTLVDKGFLKLIPTPSQIVEPNYSLNQEQQSSIRWIGEKIAANKFCSVLLYGVTGSGKTEVYIGAAIHALSKGKKVMVLVPEIALAEQMIGQLKSRLPEVSILHSRMSPGERYREWRRIKEGEVKVVLGARSAIFAPIENLGLIILDEEQENSYKSEERPRYHTAEIAAWRAEKEEAVLLLGSATPRLETLDKVWAGELPILTLQKRVSICQPLQVELEDKKPISSTIGPKLSQALAMTLNRHEQAVLFINRRGYAPRTICRSCGTAQYCPHCAVALTYHADVKRNICHYCNYSVELIEACGQCGSQYLSVAGLGTQRLEEEIKRQYPAARVARLDLDSVRHKKDYRELFRAMRAQEIDILIGTQMVAKGLDFPNVSLVGILDADALFALPDYRADERAFQLLIQAAGRAGRADRSGQVIVETYRPEDQIMQLWLQQNYFAFAEKTLQQRKLLGYPPFTHIGRFLVSGKDENVVCKTAEELQQRISMITDATEQDFQILGPAPAPIAKIKDRYRYQLIIKSIDRSFLTSLVPWCNMIRFDQTIRIEHDFDPINTM